MLLFQRPNPLPSRRSPLKFETFWNILEHNRSRSVALISNKNDKNVDPIPARMLNKFQVLFRLWTAQTWKDFRSIKVTKFWKNKTLDDWQKNKENFQIQFSPFRHVFLFPRRWFAISGSSSGGMQLAEPGTSDGRAAPAAEVAAQWKSRYRRRRFLSLWQLQPGKKRPKLTVNRFPSLFSPFSFLF